LKACDLDKPIQECSLRCFSRRSRRCRSPIADGKINNSVQHRTDFLTTAMLMVPSNASPKVDGWKVIHYFCECILFITKYGISLHPSTRWERIDTKESLRCAFSAPRLDCLDWSKSFPTSLFYFPSQARCPADSFFIECMEGRNPLNPSTWIENTTVLLQPTLESVEPNIQMSRVDEKMVQSAISTWRTSPSYPGRGNVMFFDLAFSLKYAGMAFRKIESTLHSEAQYARTPNERLAQIPSIMASLRVYSESWRDRTLAIEVPAA
jgi:hypothetical protein